MRILVRGLLRRVNMEIVSERTVSDSEWAEVVLEAKHCPGYITSSYRDPFHDLSTLMAF